MSSVPSSVHPGDLDARLPELALDIVTTQVWISRFAEAGGAVASETQLLDEARSIGEAELPSAATLQNHASNAAENLPDRLKTLKVFVRQPRDKVAGPTQHFRFVVEDKSSFERDHYDATFDAPEAGK